jgi:arylsulfatase A-like enzyme
MAKKITNFNAMRPAIVAAHNGGNRKAINKDMIDGAGIDNAYFIMWQADVRKLQETVWDYVQKKKNSRFDATITDDDIFASRERIYPKWKEILQVGEENKDSKELHVSERDVEDLVGFCWDFMATTNGTVEHKTTEQIFRKKVESLLGCAIARNAILDDKDRDTLDTYYKAQNRIQRCLDAKAEMDAQIASFELLKTNAKGNDAFIKYLDEQIGKVNENLKANAESKATAEATLKEVSGDAKRIEMRIKAIK